MRPNADQPANHFQELGRLARLFLKLGMIVFGGPAAHIAMMEDEVVRRRQGLTQEKFLDMMGAQPYSRTEFEGDGNLY